MQDNQNTVEAVARGLASADGLDFDEICGVAANPDDGYCDSGTCVAAHWEEHDADQARRWYRHMARAAIAAMRAAELAGEADKACPCCKAPCTVADIPARRVMALDENGDYYAETRLGERKYIYLPPADRDTRPAAPTDQSALVAEDSYAAWQQKRGLLADRVDWAIERYNEFMWDDAYDSQAVLDEIIAKLRDAALIARARQTGGADA